MEGYWPLQIEKMVTSTAVTYSQYMIPRGTIVQLNATVLTNIQICKDYVSYGDFGDSWRDQFYGDSQESGEPLSRVTDIWSSDADGATLDNDCWGTSLTSNEPVLDKVDPTQGLRTLEFSQADQDDLFWTFLNCGWRKTGGGSLYGRPLPGDIDLSLVVDHIETAAGNVMQWQIQASKRGDTTEIQYWNDTGTAWTTTATWNDITGSGTYAQYEGTWTTLTGAGEVGGYTYTVFFRSKADAAQTSCFEHVSVVWTMADLQGFIIGSTDGTVGHPGYVFTMPFDGRIAADAGGAGILYIQELRRN